MTKINMLHRPYTKTTVDAMSDWRWYEWGYRAIRDVNCLVTKNIDHCRFLQENLYNAEIMRMQFIVILFFWPEVPWIFQDLKQLSGEK